MEPILLMLDVIGIVLVVLWVARGRGTDGVFGWRPNPTPGQPRAKD
jgi:hypothetical protein